MSEGKNVSVLFIGKKNNFIVNKHWNLLNLILEKFPLNLENVVRNSLKKQDGGRAIIFFPTYLPGLSQTPCWHGQR